ncbi:stress protein [Pseudomonas brassicacearum]|nr:stress protein [Pseudomonas brassicacearum]
MFNQTFEPLILSNARRARLPLSVKREGQTTSGSRGDDPGNIAHDRTKVSETGRKSGRTTTSTDEIPGGKPKSVVKPSRIFLLERLTWF